MSELEKLRIVASYEFLKHIRRRRLYVILALTLVAELAVIILYRTLEHQFPDTVKGMAVLLTIGPSLAAIGAVFFAGDSIAGEFENRTGFILFTNPIRRITLIAGKYLASAAAIIIMILFGYIVTVITLLVIYGQLPSEIFNSFGLCLLYAGAVLSITFFLSSLSKGSMGATILTLVLIMVISPIVENILAVTGNPYWYLPSAGGNSIALVYGGLGAIFGGGISGGPGGGNFFLNPPDIGLISYAMTGYLVICFALSLWITKRRQLA